MSRTYVIAEAGVNHDGLLSRAEELVHAAAAAGADAVKFQAFSASALVTADAERAEYQKRNTGSDDSQREMLERLELDEAAHRHLADVATSLGLDFMSSAFDGPSLAMLGRLGLPVWKIPSGEITNLPYLREVAEYSGDARVLLSTGMSDLDEVRAAVEALEEAGVGRERLTVLHCSSEYPAPAEDVNLRAMVGMGEELGVAIGYSDHTEGIAVSIAAVALGATVIEKHLTLDRTLPGPDHAASIEPAEFAKLVSGVRIASAALGSGRKSPVPGELATRDLVRKSIVAARAIREGETLSADNLTTKRPGTGISPMRWDEVLGTVATRDYEPDEAIEL